MTRTHPADLANALVLFPIEDRIQLLTHAGSDDRQAQIVAALPATEGAKLLAEMELQRAVAIACEMYGDDLADVLGELDEEAAARIMAAMPPKESDDIQDLMRYGEYTAGGIMSPDVLAISATLSCAEAIRVVQNSPDVEMPFYLYVVSEHNKLAGVLSLRQLVTSRPDTQVKDLMNTHVVSVHTETDQEEVARIVSRYDFLAVPVVDATNTLVGVVTVDDVIDVIREEATEDILKMAGAGDDVEDTISLRSSFITRAPWLFAALGGGLVASFVISHFEDLLSKYLLLAAFIPVINGMAGNVGTQSLAIVVRGLATRRNTLSLFWKTVSRELVVGLLLGILYGIILGGVGWLRFVKQGHFVMEVAPIALALGVAMAMAMMVAATIAAALPLFFAKVGVDPAVATGPFVTTSIDIVGVLIYFNAVALFL